MKVLKWIGIGIVALIILGLLLPDSDAKEIGNENVVAEATAAKEDLEIISTSDKNTDMMNTVYVEVKNNTKKLLTAGQVKVIYKDKDGGIVGTGHGTILNLAAGKIKTIDCIAMGIENAANYEVQLEPMLYE